MTITSYTYKITATNPDIGAMEVEFSAAGLPTVLVGARMPYQGEDLDALVRSFAPLGHWETVGKTIADVQVGHEALVDMTPIAPAPTPVNPVPQVISPFQGKAALLQSGLLAQVEAYMADPTTPEVTKLAWTEATEFRRTSPTVTSLGALLGLGDAQLDDLFIQAAQIVA